MSELDDLVDDLVEENYDVEFDEPYEVVTTKMGKDALVVGNYVYHFMRFNPVDETSYYRCSNRKNKCPDSILVYNGMARIVNETHNHDSFTKIEIEVRKAEEAVMERAKNETTKVPLIYAQELAKLIQKCSKI